MLSKEGIKKKIKIPLDSGEQKMLIKSAGIIKEMIQKTI
jgi:malate/lactate dehydrogenase